MRSPANQVLFAARTAKGWFSQEQAAQEISRAGAQALGRRGYTISVRTYRAWESKCPPWPRSDQATALRAAFGVGPEALGFAVAPGLVFDRPIDDHGVVPPVERRTALSTGVAVIGLPWLTPSTAIIATPQRVGRDEVELLQATIADLDAIDQQFGSDRLWRSAQPHLRYVHLLINEGSYEEEIGQELHDLAGQLTTSLGWFCYDADQHGQARVYFSEALNTAMLAGNEELATRTLSNMARQSVDLGKPREAVRFARNAESYAAKWSAPARVTALLAVRTAHGYARLGDEVNTSFFIKRAWRAFDQGTTDRDPAWTGFLNEAELTCLEGMCRADLGSHKQAVRLLERSAQLQDVTRSRNRGMCLARLARASVGSADFDRTDVAAKESLRLIESGQTSTRTRRQLASVREGLRLYQDVRQARETMDLLATHIA
ncbi:hypothetical protein [Streptomyces sp. WAC07061]|uniref:hypothetical protein n=1 Tax=Streptomyces sp. WAC07061 TaxID=2487410 RepID=UPI00163C4A68|nr:hypothetical protein [Streptomyces sp. WAC07061]